MNLVGVLWVSFRIFELETIIRETPSIAQIDSSPHSVANIIIPQEQSRQKCVPISLQSHADTCQSHTWQNHVFLLQTKVNDTHIDIADRGKAPWAFPCAIFLADPRDFYLNLHYAN